MPCLFRCLCLRQHAEQGRLTSPRVFAMMLGASARAAALSADLNSDEFMRQLQFALLEPYGVGALDAVALCTQEGIAR